MTINSGDSLIANLINYPQAFGKNSGTAFAAGTPHTPWYTAGITGAGSAPTGALNGATFSGTVAGQIPVPAAVTGETSRLAGLRLVQAANIGAAWLVDRLWGDVPVVTLNTSQAVTSPTWPARDASASTAGAGVLLAVECSSATTAGATVTVTYTNSAGTGSRTATATWPAAAVAGTFIPMALAAGDIGVRSVQSIQFSASLTAGQVHLIAYRPIATVPVPTANIATLLSWDQLGLPAIWDNSVLQLVYWPTGTAVGAVSGDFTYAQG